MILVSPAPADKFFTTSATWEAPLEGINLGQKKIFAALGISLEKRYHKYSEFFLQRDRLPLRQPKSTAYTLNWGKKAKGPENVDKMRIIDATQYPVFDPGDRLVEKLVKSE